MIKRDRTYVFIIIFMLVLLAGVIYWGIDGDVEKPFFSGRTGRAGGNFLDAITNGLTGISEGIGELFQRVGR